MNDTVQGILLIAMAVPDAELSADHEQIWFGEIKKVPDTLTGRLIELGWWRDRENGAWSKHV